MINIHKQKDPSENFCKTPGQLESSSSLNKVISSIMLPSSSSSSTGTQPTPSRRILADDNIPIAAAREAYAAAESSRRVDPPLITLTPEDLAARVTTRINELVYDQHTHGAVANIQVTVSTEAVKALMQQAATAALTVLATGWPRVVEEERVRHTAATLLHVQNAGVAAEWNRR
jgi:hypothetical protein